jgi:superfamily I DNA and/or RNA helicase
MKDAVDRMAHIEGKDHVIITPYTAQVEVLRREREGAITQALSRRQPVLAKRLADIDIVTIDSFMGKDRNSVTVDMTGALGHLWKLPRAVVATTRAKVSMQCFGPLDEFKNPTNNIPMKHPLRKMFVQLYKRVITRGIVGRRYRKPDTEVYRGCFTSQLVR